MPVRNLSWLRMQTEGGRFQFVAFMTVLTMLYEGCLHLGPLASGLCETEAEKKLPSRMSI